MHLPGSSQSRGALRREDHDLLALASKFGAQAVLPRPSTWPMLGDLIFQILSRDAGPPIPYGTTLGRPLRVRFGANSSPPLALMLNMMAESGRTPTGRGIDTK